MNPYGTWRCKGKNDPSTSHAPGHVNTKYLRLDSTGEITSDDSSADRCVADMGTFIESAVMKMQGRIDSYTKKSLVDQNCPVSCAMDSFIGFNNMDNNKRAMNIHSQSSPYIAPHRGHFNRVTQRPNCSLSNFKNTSMCSPEFESFNNWRTGFHPAMTGQHLGQKDSVRGSPRWQQTCGQKSNRRPVYSFQSQKEHVPSSDCTNWRKPEEHNWRSRSPNSQNTKSSSVDSVNVNEDASQNTTCSQTKSVDNSNETPVINIKCAMPNLEKSTNSADVNVETPTPPKVSAAVNMKPDVQQKSASVEILDWFECGQPEDKGRTDLPQRIGFRVRTVSIDSESMSDPSTEGKKTLQRETSVISDIFQPDETVYHVTCRFQEVDAKHEDKDGETSTDGSHSQNEQKRCSKGDSETTDQERLVSQQSESKDNAENIHVDSDFEKEFAKSIVLLVRNNNKSTCRPSSKKRRRSKARKDPSEIQNPQDENCQQINLSKSPEMTRQKTGSANTTVAFVVGFDSNLPSNPSQSHSFLVSFDGDLDELFSDDSEDDFSDCDGMDELDFFSCPLQLSVICPMDQKDSTDVTPEPCSANTRENAERQREIDAINSKWKVNLSISQPKKSKSKVCFAEGEELCTVYYVDAEDRKGHWEEFVRDRERFQRRIAEVEDILKPVLSMERRDRIYHEFFKNGVESVS